MAPSDASLRLAARQRRRNFKQQHLTSWKLLLLPQCFLPSLALLAILCFALATLLFLASRSVTESYFDYTSCYTAPPDFTQPVYPKSVWHSLFVDPLSSISAWKFNNASNTCTINFKIAASLQPPVILFIRLSNFLQNHRNVVKSLSQSQLSGKFSDVASLGKTAGGDPICGFLQYANCDTASKLSFVADTSRTPLDRYNVDCIPPPEKRDPLIQSADPRAQYYPCGLLANSFFSDEISPLKCLNEDCLYEFLEDDISWEESGYKNLDVSGIPPADIPKLLIPPPQWRKHLKFNAGYNSTNLPTIATWSRFHNWMRPAGLSTFRKTWGKSLLLLKKGEYQINITDNFDVRKFGTKSLVFSSVSAIRSANFNYLAVVSVCLGGVGLICFVVLGSLYLWGGRKAGDKSLLSWFKESEAEKESEREKESDKSGNDHEESVKEE